MRNRVPTRVLLSDLQVPPHPKSYSDSLMYPSQPSLIVGHHRNRTYDGVFFPVPQVCTEFTLTRVSFPLMLDQTTTVVPPFSKPTLTIIIMSAFPTQTWDKQKPISLHRLYWKLGHTTSHGITAGSDFKHRMTHYCLLLEGDNVSGSSQYENILSSSSSFPLVFLDCFYTTIIVSPSSASQSSLAFAFS